jgi:TolB-like protein/class 3 adenylate cyclase
VGAASTPLAAIHKLPAGKGGASAAVTSQRVERRLAAILAGDVANYSRLMGVDEVGTLETLKAHRREIVDPAIAQHKGRIVKTTGDGMLVEFASTVDAVTCAIAIQEKMAERSASGPEPRIRFRIGINVGEIIIDGDDIFGDGVNVAARVENECEPGGVYVSANAFEQIRGKTKFAFDDLGDRTLKNIDRPVRVYAVRGARSLAIAATGALLTPASNANDPPPLPDKPSIAVLPFQNLSGDPEQEYFADGMVEDIITVLSRFKSLFVIARNSSFSYKGKSPDIRQVGRELGVRYVLEGSVRKAGNRLRISGQLIDASSGAHLWADRFDGSIEDVFKLQDQMAEGVVAAIAPRLEQAEIDRSKRKAVGNLGAYDCYLRSLAHLQHTSKHSLEQAKQLLRQAIELDPELAPAYGLLLQCHAGRTGFGLVPNPDEEKAEVARLVRIVLRVGHDDAEALSGTAFAVAYVLRDLPRAQLLVDRAVALNPNLALGWVNNGWINLWSGNPALAVEHLKQAMRHDPLQPDRVADRVASARAAMAHALFFLGKYNEAMACAETLRQTHPDSHPALRVLAASAACANLTHVARDMANQYQLARTQYPRKLPRVLAPDQVAGLLEAAPGPGLKHKAALSIAYGAGLRGGEVSCCGSAISIPNAC